MFSQENNTVTHTHTLKNATHDFNGKNRLKHQKNKIGGFKKTNGLHMLHVIFFKHGPLTYHVGWFGATPRVG